MRPDKPKLLFLLIIFFVSCSNNNHYNPSSGSSDLKVSASYEIPPLMGKIRIFGTIQNYSSHLHANPLLFVSLLDEKYNEISSEYVTISGTCYGNSSLSFDEKINRISGVKHVSIRALQ